MPSNADPQALPRCCPSHASWHSLADHLIDEFPELTIRDVLRELLGAREATNSAGLPELEALEAAELITRHQLLLLTGRLIDAARLDPEVHRR